MKKYLYKVISTEGVRTILTTFILLFCCILASAFLAHHAFATIPPGSSNASSCGGSTAYCVEDSDCCSQVCSPVIGTDPHTTYGSQCVGGNSNGINQYTCGDIGGVCGEKTDNGCAGNTFPGYVYDNAGYNCLLGCCRPGVCEDLPGSYCHDLGPMAPNNNCNPGYHIDFTYACSKASQKDDYSTCCVQNSACTTGASGCFYSSGPFGAPANTCYTNNGSINQTCSHNQPQPCNNQSYTTTIAYTYDNCNHGAGYTCTNNSVCTTSITVHVYKDYNHDGVVNGNDAGFAGVTITDNGGNFPTTDNTGTVVFTGKATGTHTISMTVPAGYQAVGTSTQQVTLTNNVGNQTVNFYLTTLYQISGTVFTDLDQSQCYNSSGQSCVGKNGLTYAAGTDTAFTNGSHITIAGPVNTSVNASGGGYNSTQILTSGTYTVTYDTGTTPLPSGYRFTTSQSYSVTVGDPAGTPACSIGAAPDTLNTKCQNPNNGSIVQLNFGVINETQWQQSICNDIRVDSGYSQQIPSTANCSNTSSTYAIMGNNICPLDNTNTASNQGVLFSGNTNPNTGQGSVSSGGQQVGNSTYGEIFVPHSLSTIESKYALVMESLNNLSTPATKLSTVCPVLTNCDLKTLPGGGVYTTTAADGPVTLYASGDNTLASQNYTFVIGGDLTITSNILTTVGYSAAFISGGDIHVTGTGNTNAGEVGETDWTSTNPDLEGFFSADGSFYVDRINTADFTCNTDGSPIDKKLNIAGTVVTNAAGNGGSIVNNREGCSEDLQCPAILFPPNVQQILHPPTPLRIPLTFWSELNP